MNHDTHGDGPRGATHGFSKGREVETDSGERGAPLMVIMDGSGATELAAK